VTKVTNATARPTVVTRSSVCPLVAISLGASKYGVKKGTRLTIFGLSNTDFSHLTANVSKRVSRSVIHVTCELTSAQQDLSKIYDTPYLRRVSLIRPKTNMSYFLCIFEAFITFYW